MWHHLFRILLLCLLILLLGALAWPVSFPGEKGTAEQARVCRSKLAGWWMQTQQGTRWQGVLGEDEINACLAYWSTGRPQSFHVDLQSGTLDLYIHIKRSLLTLSYRLSLEPSVDAENVNRFLVDQVSLGHLPLPKIFSAGLIENVATVFSDMERERRIFEKCTEMTVKSNEIRLVSGSLQPTKDVLK